MAEGPVDRLTAHIVHNYQVAGEISRDAFSRLFQATSPSLGTAVIIQVIPGELVGDAEFPDRFQARMRKAASLAHRNLLRVHHFAHDPPNYYVVLDYFDGEPLSRLMESGPLPVERVLEVLKQVLEALDHAHKNGIAHGALHPGGILVASDDEVRMTGFGIAKALDPQSMLVEAPGNPYPYKSPEQAMGLPVDARSDLYSLGLIIWQALAGRLPAGGEVSAPGSVNPRVSPELDEVILRMLVPRPRDRLRTARQVAIALSGALRAQQEGKPRAAVAPRRSVRAEMPPAPQAQPASAAVASPSAGDHNSVANAGVAAYKAGNIEDAVRLLEEAAEALPRSVRVLANLGAAYYAAERYGDAEDALKRALGVRPDLATLRYDLGNALLAQGKVPEAKQELQRAWSEDPNCSAALLLLVELEGVPR